MKNLKTFIQSDLNFEVLKKFSDQGEIPFPRDINLSLNKKTDLKNLKGNKI